MLKRSINLISSFIYDTEYSISDIAKFVEKDDISLATLKRDLSVLVKGNFLSLIGEKRASKYKLTSYGLLHRDFQIENYYSNTEYKKTAFKSYNFDLFDILKEVDLFTKEEMASLDKNTKIYHDKATGKSEVIEKKELERFIIELSWKSSAIEGNTYTMLDTENLIRYGKGAIGHDKDEATMILNHKKAFDYILESKRLNKDLISFRELENIHRLLVSDLGIDHGMRKVGVGITGTSYLPLDAGTQIEIETRKLVDIIKSKKDHYSKALIAVLGISYLQSFEDGNKRTARLFANAMLISGDYGPLSYRDVEEVDYRSAVVIFYEQNSIQAFKKIFIEQYIYSCGHYNIAPIPVKL